MKVAIRTAAREDILRQYQYYLDEVNETVAEKFLKSIESAIAQVCRHPGIGVPKLLSSSKLTGLRSWPGRGFPEIHVYYLISEEMLRIVRVLHGKRDIDPLLEAENEKE